MHSLKKALLLAALIITPTLIAGPGSNIPVQLTQPDGTKVWVRIKGDEHQRWVQTLAGYTVLLNNDKQIWEYALPTKGGALTPSGIAVEPGGEPPVAIPRNLKPLRDIAGEQATIERLGLKAGGEWDPSLIAGTRNLLFIAVSFNDRQLVTTAADWDTALFDTTPGAKTMANFYNDNSQGLITPVPAPNTQTTNPNGGIVTVSINQNHPNTGTANYPANRQYRIETGWINDALAAASTHVDFQALDTDNNGTLELDEAVVYFIVAGYDASGSANLPSVWGHKWGVSSVGDVQAAGVNVNRWAINGELYDTGDRHSIGVVTHELGHLMCSLPDLYDINGQNSGLGSYSLMSGGSWGTAAGDNIPGATPVNMDAWCRTVIGWANPRRPASTDTVSFGLPLSTLDQPVMLRNEADKAYEYFLVENRYPTGWDLGMQGTLESAVSDVQAPSGTIASNPMTYTPAGTATGTAVLCGEGQVGEFPAAVNGEIALISRGTISFVEKVLNAKAAGATAVIVYNNTTGELLGTLGSPGDYIPAVGVSQADGPGLAGATVTVTVNTVNWDGGLLVLHVDETVGTRSGNSINSSANSHQGITAIEADPTVGSLLTGDSSGDARHLYYAGNNAEFSPTSNPNSDYWDGSASGLGIYNVSAAGATMSASMSSGPVGPQAPIAGFSYSATDLTVVFTDTSSDADGSITSWSWDFGDGNASISQDPSHTYAADGTYAVTLTVTDNDGQSDSITQNVSVSLAPVNQAPTANFSYNATDLSVAFTDGSSDSDGTIASWSWDFGDGNSSTAQNPSHSYAAAGTYTVTLTVTDNDGATDSASQSVTVSDPVGGNITLSATGYKVKGLQKADLTWSGATGTNVDIYRDGVLIATTANDGAFTDNIDLKGPGAYTYEVCDAGTSTCSNSVNVTF